MNAHRQDYRTILPRICSLTRKPRIDCNAAIYSSKYNTNLYVTSHETVAGKSSAETDESESHKMLKINGWLSPPRWLVTCTQTVYLPVSSHPSKL